MSALYSHPGTPILRRTFNNSGTKPTRIHLQAGLSAASAHRLQSMRISSGAILYRFSFSYLLLFNLTDLILQNHEGKKKKTCKVMRFSVNLKSQHQQPCMMQEAIGMGSLQSREHLPFKRRTFKEWDFEQSYFCLQPFLPSFSPAMSKIYKQWQLELCKIYHFR